MKVFKLLRTLDSLMIVALEIIICLTQKNKNCRFKIKIREAKIILRASPSEYSEKIERMTVPKIVKI